MTLKLCHPCTRARGVDPRKSECLCLGVIRGKCWDCNGPIGSQAGPNGEHIPYFVQWLHFFTPEGGEHAVKVPAS